MGHRNVEMRVNHLSLCFPQRLLEEMEGLLVCWRGLLLPLTSDPQLSTVTQKIHKSLTALGVEITKDMLKVCACIGLESFLRFPLTLRVAINPVSPPPGCAVGFSPVVPARPAAAGPRRVSRAG